LIDVDQALGARGAGAPLENWLGHPKYSSSQQ
jgi:hypothetical protein